MIRSPIICILGHVDHGKTSLADYIRGSAIAKHEAGGITQMIGASFIPSKIIAEICGEQLKQMKTELKVPGLLFIDTPGHEAFTNLRRRGGSLADLAILVVDITQGFQPQTIEALEILKEYKTPFLIAANKIDLVSGWRDSKELSFLKAMEKQSVKADAELDKLLYQLIGRLHEFKFSAERFDRVNDFSKYVAIVPTSAKTGEGISELLIFLAGLSQRYMEDKLKIEVEGPGKGSILEVKEEKGLGTTIDVVLYDGSIKKGDTIVFGTVDGAEVTKVRAILRERVLPGESSEKFTYVDEAYAAAGVKIFAPNLEKAVSGSPIFVAQDNVEELRMQIKHEISDVLVKTTQAGVILKANTLGSVEAITKLLASANIPVKEAGLGNVIKKNVVDAQSVKYENKYYGVILGFNVKVMDDAEKEARRNGIEVISSNIIYALLDRYQEWVKQEQEKEKEMGFSKLIMPGKVKVLSGYCFRVSKPAVFGVEILGGRIKSDYKLVKGDGEVIGIVKAIQKENESVQEAVASTQVAISMAEPTFGRQVKEGDVYYTMIPKDHIRLLREKYKVFLSDEESKLLEEIAAVLTRAA
ncbi:translation initiation factor IF-2 [Candidatus Micrarchaeota archaeon]|nr:translation initiation factor IF-2 [Candidatus Micrarchaeota archaeon]